MRVPAIVLAIAISAPAPAAGPAPDQPVQSSAQIEAVQTVAEADDCPRTTSHLAGRETIYPGAPLTPKKLTELPPAVTYMAVHRTIDGCEVPLTMTEYRASHRP